MRICARIATLLLLIIGVEYDALALDEGVSPRNFKIARSALSEKLLQQTVRQTFQDSSGLIWILTQEGLHRFDGYELLFYQADGDNGNKISHNNVRHILEDSNGTIWLATTGGGLNYYKPSDRSFGTIRSSNTENTPLSDNISALIEDSNEMLWVGYLDGSLSMFDPATREFSHGTFFNLNAPEHGAITAMVVADDTHLWIATTKGGLHLVEQFTGAKPRNNNMTQRVNQSVQSLITALLVDSENQLWIGTESDGVILLSKDGYLSKIFAKNVNEFGSLPSNAITNIYEDSDGRIWVGSDAGLSVLGKDNKFTTFDNNTSDLEENFVMSIMQDKDSNYWIGTHYGLFSGFHSRFELFTSSNGLPNESITSFAETKNGQLWVGTYEGLFWSANDLENLLDENETNYLAGGLSDPRIMSLEAMDNLLFIGSRNAGVSLLDATHDPPSTKNGSVATGPITRIMSDQRGDLWVSTFGEGITRISSDSSVTFSTRDEFNSRISSDYVYDTLETKDGDILVATTQGLNRFDSENNRIVAITSSKQSTLSIETANILALAEDPSGNIWMGLQYQGLALWQAEDRANSKPNFSRVTSTPAIPSATVYTIEQDRNGHLWLSTTNGLARLNPADLTLRTFDYSDGLQDNEFNFGASFKDSKGRLYFGGNRGFNRFDPEKVVEPRAPPQFVLTDIELAGKPVPYDVAYIDIKDLELSHEDYYVNFQFSALDYTNPNKNRYRYMLENFDRDWVDLGARHTASFTNLPSGYYTLRLMGANSDGVWNKDGKSLRLKVNPAPWLTWWAFASYFGGLFWLLWFALRYYETYMLKERALELADTMHGTAESAMDDLEDHLDVQQSLIENVRDHTEQVMSLVSDLLDRQAEMIDDPVLLDVFKDNIERFSCLSQLEHNLYYMGERLEVNFHAYLEGVIAERFPSQYIGQANVAVVNEATRVGLPASIAVACAIIVNECLSNCYKHAFTDSPGVHFVKVLLEENTDLVSWQLEISDSGIGLPENIDPLNPSTLGLEIVRELASSIHADMTVGRTSGTALRFRIPKPALDPDRILVPR